MDYLSHLISRSFELSEDVQWVHPRLPSRFEPPQETWDAPVETPSWSPSKNESRDDRPPLRSAKVGAKLMRPEQDVEKGERAVSQNVVASADAPHLSKTQEEGSLGTDENPMGDVQPTATVLPREAPATATPMRAVGIFRQKEGLAVDIRSTPYSEPEAGRKAHAHAGRPIVKPTAGGRPESAKDLREKWSPEPQGTPDERQLSSGNLTLKESVVPIAGQVFSSGIKVREQDDPILPWMAKTSLHTDQMVSPVLTKPDLLHPAVKPEPTIQVTIGRIEVRAVTQAAARRIKPKGPAPMSLDDYLKRRSGGGR